MLKRWMSLTVWRWNHRNWLPTRAQRRAAERLNKRGQNTDWRRWQLHTRLSATICNLVEGPIYSRNFWADVYSTQKKSRAAASFLLGLWPRTNPRKVLGLVRPPPWSTKKKSISSTWFEQKAVQKWMTNIFSRIPHPPQKNHNNKKKAAQQCFDIPDGSSLSDL